MDTLNPPSLDIPPITTAQREHLYATATGLSEQFAAHYPVANRVVMADALVDDEGRHGVIVDVIAVHGHAYSPQAAFDPQNHVGRVATFWCTDAELARRVLAKLHDEFTAKIYAAP